MPSAPSPIVIADDDSDDVFFARRSLQKAGIRAECLTCMDGREVVALLQDMAKAPEPIVPRVVFLDIKMPRMDGFETLRWIRSNKTYKKLPVVMLSGSDQARDIALARKLGADEYLVKYPAPSEFARVVGAAGARV